MFTILNVSQTGGKAAGGSVITVTAAGIVGTPTSTLGAVSNITSSTFQITTTAHAAGAVSWTATNGNGQTSSPHTFTYLAAPVVSTITPNNGPQTAPNVNSATYSTTGVIFTVSGLPAVGAGVAISATIDGNALVSVVNNGNGTITGTVPVDTNSGAVNVVVNVDGVASTGGTGAWTYNAPPSVASVTSVGTSGGSATCDGANFVQTPTASANINGTPTNLTVTWVSSAELVELLLTGGSYAVGHWDLTVTNPDGQSVTAPGVFVITSELTPETIFGANLIAWWQASNATSVGGVLTGVPDSTGNGNDLSVVSLVPPTIVDNDARFGEAPTTILMNGSTNFLQTADVPIGAGSTLAFFGVVDLLSTSVGGGGEGTFITYSSDNNPKLLIQGSSPTNLEYIGPSNHGIETSGIQMLNAPATLYGGATVVGGTVSEAVSINNSTPVTYSASTATSIENNKVISVGFDGIGEGYLHFVWPELLIVNVVPTALQISQYVQSANDRFGVTAPPSVNYATPVPALTSNAPLRLNGTGFMQGVTVTLGSTASCTVLSNTTTVVNVETPSLAAGTYDLTIANMDGRSITYGNYVTVTAATSPWSLFGLSCVAWYDSTSFVESGGVVTQWTDLSGMGNHLVAGTAPAYHSGAGDPTFNDQPYMKPNGTNEYLQCLGAQFASNPLTAIWCSCVVNQVSGGGGGQQIFQIGGTLLFQLSNEIPDFFLGGAGTVSWGSTISGAQNLVFTCASGANPNYSVNVANGAAVVNTSTIAPIDVLSSDLYTSSYEGGGNWNAQPIAAIIVLSVIPSSGAQSSWESYCQTTWGCA